MKCSSNYLAQSQHAEQMMRAIIKDLKSNGATIRGEEVIMSEDDFKKTDMYKELNRDKN